MFKDYNKYLSASLKVYLFVLVCVFIMKIVGLDYFGLDLTNPIIQRLQLFLSKYWVIRDIIYFIPMFSNEFVIVTITCKDNSKKIKKYLILLIPIFYLFEVLNIRLFGNLSILIEYIYLIIIISIYNKKINLKSIKRTIITTSCVVLMQIISTFTRLRYSIEYVDNIPANIILNLDFFIMLIISYKMYFLKGGFNLCYQVDQCSSSLKKISLKMLLKKSQENYHNFKQLPKVERLSIIIYIVLSLIWNTLSLIIILIVAQLNHTFIECLFILTSFWLSKRTFGKPFHLSSMAQCFVVSNLTYYTLNRITMPLGISMFVPILLGVGLSYVTSKFVKKTYKPLYKGMPEELFEETILKVVDKDSIKYNVCYDFYIRKESDVSLSFKYNYSVAGIRKIKDRINQKIKELK